MTEKRVSAALVGMGGYGMIYVNEILDKGESYGMDCVAMVDIYPEKCDRIDEIKERGIPVYTDMEEMYKHCQPELVFISTPIQFHCRQVCFALEHGSNVLCEKPVAATLADAKKMLEVVKRTNRFVAIGFQMCYHHVLLEAKKDMISGVYGKPIKFKAMIGQRRNLAYYQRGWAGKIKAGDDYIYDSVANNSAAHYLHNLYFMAGDELNRSAFPKEIEAECYRGNYIENFDTITAKITTTTDVELYFAAFQCGERFYDHYAVCQLEKGTVSIEQDGRVVGKLNNGEIKNYGSLYTPAKSKMQHALEAVRGEDTIFCDINTAMAHVQTIQYIQDNVKVTDLTERSEVINVANEGETPNLVRCVKGLDDAMKECFEYEKMLSAKI